MKTPDPEWILKIISNYVGKDMLYLRRRFSEGADVEHIYALIFGKLLSQLEECNSSTLGQIIEYSNLNVKVGFPCAIIRRASFSLFEPEDLRMSLSPTESFHGIAGRELLQVEAMLTIVVIVIDLLSQERYAADDARLQEERETENWWSSFSLPKDHPDYGKPPEARTCSHPQKSDPVQDMRAGVGDEDEGSPRAYDYGND